MTLITGFFAVVQTVDFVAPAIDAFRCDIRDKEEHFMKASLFKNILHLLFNFTILSLITISASVDAQMNRRIRIPEDNKQELLTGRYYALLIAISWWAVRRP